MRRDLPLTRPAPFRILDVIRNRKSYSTRMGARMHIPDGFLSAPVFAAGYAVSGAVCAVAVARANRKLGEREVPLLGMTAAFVFAAQMLNFPVAGGTSGHFLGATLRRGAPRAAERLPGDGGRPGRSSAWASPTAGSRRSAPISSTWGSSAPSAAGCCSARCGRSFRRAAGDSSPRRPWRPGLAWSRRRPAARASWPGRGLPAASRAAGDGRSPRLIGIGEA